MEYYVEKAKFTDVEGIFDVIRAHAKEVLPRSYSDIICNIDRFFVCRSIEGNVVGTVSWKILPEIGIETDHVIEIVSLSVSDGHQKQGLGAMLVNAVMEEIKQFNPSRVILLTFTPEFFSKLGFTRTGKEELYGKIYMGCVNCLKYKSPLTCPEVAMEIRY